MEARSDLEDMTKDELKEYAADKYGVELSTSNRKDAMIEKFLYEIEQDTGNQQLERLNTNLTYAAIVIGVLLAFSVGMDIRLSNQISNLEAPSGGNGGSPSPNQGNQGNNGGNGGSGDTADVSFDDTDPVKGQEDAPVTIIEFSDFECPFCKRFYDNTYGQIVSNYVESGDVKIVYRDLPLNRLHPQAESAAVAAQCVFQIGGNDAFWDYHDTIFNNQNQLSESSLKQWAGDVGVSQSEFNSCFDNQETLDEVNADKSAAQSAGASGTPTFFINGQKLVGAQPYNRFQQVIDSQLN